MWNEFDTNSADKQQFFGIADQWTIEFPTVNTTYSKSKIFFYDNFVCTGRNWAKYYLQRF